MLSLDHITVRIGSSTLLHDAATAVRRPGCTAVVGANGAGKTTLLRVACGEHVPTTGRVTMDEVPLNRLSTAAQARRRAVLPQHARLGFACPVFEVVLMGRTPHARGAAPPRRRDRCSRAGDRGHAPLRRPGLPYALRRRKAARAPGACAGAGLGTSPRWASLPAAG